MDILIGIVIAFIIIVAGYVGMYASQQTPEVGGHDISLELDILGGNSEMLQTNQTQIPFKSIV